MGQYPVVINKYLDIKVACLHDRTSETQSVTGEGPGHGPLAKFPSLRNSQLKVSFEIDLLRKNLSFFPSYNFFKIWEVILGNKVVLDHFSEHGVKILLFEISSKMCKILAKKIATSYWSMAKFFIGKVANPNLFLFNGAPEVKFGQIEKKKNLGVNFRSCFLRSPNFSF